MLQPPDTRSGGDGDRTHTALISRTGRTPRQEHADTWLARHGIPRTRKPAPTAAVRPLPRHRTRRPVAINAQIILVDGVEPLDAVAIYEVLRAGGVASGGALTVELVSVDVLDPDRCDLVVVPGAADVYTAPAEHLPSSVAQALETDLPVWVKHALDNPDVTVAAIGGGALMLAMAGLFDGRHVATHDRGVHLLEGTGAILSPSRVVDDGDLITATGITAGVDVGLYILERELGPRIAHSVEQLFAYERRGTVWRAAGAEPVL